MYNICSPKTSDVLHWQKRKVWRILLCPVDVYFFSTHICHCQLIILCKKCNFTFSRPHRWRPFALLLVFPVAEWFCEIQFSNLTPRTTTKCIERNVTCRYGVVRISSSFFFFYFFEITLPLFLLEYPCFFFQGSGQKKSFHFSLLLRVLGHKSKITCRLKLKNRSSIRYATLIPKSTYADRNIWNREDVWDINKFLYNLPHQLAS